MLFAGGLGLANAQPAPSGNEDGKIDVALGTITTIEGVDVAAAEQISALVCSDAVSNDQLSQVDRGDAADVTCTSAQGSQVITFTQSDQGDVGFAPAQHAPTDEVPTDEVPTTTPTNPVEGPQHDGPVDGDTEGGAN
ncbi:hypothetical protein [Mycolicibacterium thermoresistibile]